MVKHLKRIITLTLAVAMMAMTTVPFGFGALNGADSFVYAAEEDADTEAAESEEAVDEEENGDSEEAVEAEESKDESDTETVEESEDPQPVSYEADDSDAESADADGEFSDEDAAAEDTVAVEEDEDADAEEAGEIYELTYEGKGYRITVTGGAEAGLTENSGIKVREISEDPDDSSEYDNLYDTAQSEVKAEAGDNAEISFAKFYDITLTDEDGNEFEPSAPVDVNIEYEKEVSKDLKAEKDGNISVIHFADKDSAELLGSDADKDSGVETTLKDDQLEKVAFTAESFSVYAVAQVSVVHNADGTDTYTPSDVAFKVTDGSSTYYCTSWNDILANCYNKTAAGRGNCTNTVKIDVLADYTFTSYDIGKFKTHTTGNMTVNGGGHTLSRGNGVTGSLITWNPTGGTTNGAYGSLTINNAIFNNGSESDKSSMIINKMTGVLVCNDTTFDGNSTEASLVAVASIFNNTFNNCTITAGTGTAAAIADGSSGALRFENCTINGAPTVSNNTLVLKSGLGRMDFVNTVINGKSSTGVLINRSQYGIVAFNGGTFNGADTATDSPMFRQNVIYDISFESVTINRKQTKGPAIEVGSGNTVHTLSLNNCTVDGNNTAANAPLIRKMSGILELKNTTVRNHTAAEAGVCAVGTNGAANVFVSGSTQITGNTADGKAANLGVTGTSVLRIPAASELTGTVGVYSPNYNNGTQFGYLVNDDTSKGFEKFVNDRLSTTIVTADGHALLWAEKNTGSEQAVESGNDYFYKGLEYDLDAGKKTAKVHGYDTRNRSNWSDIPVIPASVPYGDWKYAVTDITFFGSAATLRNKNLIFEDAMLDKMANGATIGLPDITTAFTQAITSAVDGYVAGERNSETPGSQNVWKNATINPETNVIEYSLKYLQMLNKDQPLDFIFGVDQTGTMCTGDATANGVKAPRVMWMMAMLQKTSYELVSKNNAGYDNRVAFIPWGGDSAKTSDFMSTKADIDNWFRSSDTYSRADYGTYHYVAAEAIVKKAEKSIEQGRNPVSIYLSDFMAHADSHKNYEYVKQLRSASYRTYAVVVFNDGTDYAQYYQNAGIYKTSDPGEFMGIFSNIIKDAIGYYLDKPLKVTDDLSSPISGLTPEVVSADGTTVTQTGKAEWTLGEQDPLLTANNMYETVFTADLGDDIYSGSMHTNAELVVTDKDGEVNRISGNNSPVLGKGLTIAVKEKSGLVTDGRAVRGAAFELKDGNNTVWTGTSPANGKMTIPYGTGENQCAFPVGSTYTLRQLSTDDDHVLPAGSWTLTVGSDYKISLSVNASPSKENRTIAASAKKGTLEVYNDIEPVVTYDLQGGSINGSTDAVEDAVSFNTTEVSHAYEVMAADSITAPAQNKVFTGWNTKADGSGESIAPRSSMTVYRTENDSFITLYAQWRECRTLTITNENTGDYSNSDDSFEVTLTLEPADGDAALTGVDDSRLARITGPSAWKVTGNKAEMTLTVDGTTNNSNAIVLPMIPSGWKYKVKEVDSKGYIVEYKNGSGDYASALDGVSGELTNDTTVNIRNTRDNVVVSGIVSRSSLKTVIALAALSIMTAAFFIFRRRRLVKA